MKKIAVLFAVVILSLAALAESTDDLYSRAVNKYFLGDNDGAIVLLKQALDTEPGNAKARTLLNEIQPASVPVPTVTPVIIAPTTTRPTVAAPVKPARPQLAAKKSEVIKEEPKIIPAGLRFPELPSAPKFASMENSINQIIILLLAAIIIAAILASRGVYFVVKDYLYEIRRQACPDCKTKNPPEAEFCHLCGTRLRAWSGVTEGQRKWFAKFKWKRNPFTLDIMPSLFTGYTGQVNSIMEKVNTASGHILVYGDKGVGKTTLLKWLASNLQKDYHAIYIPRPPINFEDLSCVIANELIGRNFWKKKKTCSLYDLEAIVKGAKKRVVILMDEAHEFTAVIEQQMRSLGDIPGVKYILAGLPEAKEKIKRDSPPFYDRIVLEVYLEHLNAGETRDMIKKRIEDVGGEDVKPFTNPAVENIFKMSRGRPRMVLKVCDWVLTDAIRNNLEVIGGEVGQDFPDKTEENKAGAVS